MAGTREYGDEPSGFIKCGEFLDQLQNELASQEGLCSMEYVSKYATCCGHIFTIFIHKYTLSKTEVDMRKTVLCDL